MMRIRSRLLLTAASCIVLGACRDGVAPFTPVPIDTESGPLRRLTFNENADVNPSWSATSDTVYYTAKGFIDYPAIAYTMLRLSVDSGPATRVAPDAQPGNSGSVMAPVLSPNRASFAYVHVPFIMPDAICVTANPACNETEPLLDNGFVRVRPVGARGAASADVGVAIPFQGSDPARALGGAAIYNQRSFPFQFEFRLMGALLFRPTWAPDGQRIAFSDGLALRVWNTSQATSDVIPNTADGVSAAWSPTGQQIAFARIVRGDSTLIQCECYEPPGPPGENIPLHRRWTYTISRSIVTLVNPDGSGRTEIADGADPAWSPDGSTIYFVRDNQIFSVSRTGGTPVAIAQTTGGRSPAVSPDGKWLAFARRVTADKSNDIWILRLGSQ